MSPLNTQLWAFYAIVRNASSAKYSVSSFLSLRAGLNRYISKYNIIGQSAFKSSNDNNEGHPDKVLHGWERLQFSSSSHFDR